MDLCKDRTDPKDTFVDQPQPSFTLFVTEKKLAGGNTVLTAVAPGQEQGSLIAQFSAVFDRAFLRGVDLEDQIEITVTLKPKSEAVTAALPEAA
jgi:hypothetical protein